jgi:hypothetical protein
MGRRQGQESRGGGTRGGKTVLSIEGGLLGVEDGGKRPGIY